MKVLITLFKKNISIFLIFIFSLFCIIFFTFIIFYSSNNSNSIIYKETYPVVMYRHHTLIDDNYTFDNEGLNRPHIVREDHNTKNIVVLDEGNECLYIFSKNGEFIRKIGQPGQGPGDLLGPRYLVLDSIGNIYVHELTNYRISIFSQDGKFITSFRISGDNKTIFSVSKDRTILVNEPDKGYYISIYSKEGRFIKNIGKIPEVNKYNLKNVDKLFAKGWPFLDDKGNFYIFLHHLGEVKIFNEHGELIKKQILDLPQIKSILNEDVFVLPENHKYIKDPIFDFFQEIIFYNNYFYILFIDSNLKRGKNKDQPSVIIYKLDEKFNISKKIILDIDNYDIQGDNRVPMSDIIFKTRMYLQFQFEIASDEDYIYYPHKYNAKIYLFKIIN